MTSFIKIQRQKRLMSGNNSSFRIRIISSSTSLAKIKIQSSLGDQFEEFSANFEPNSSNGST
jgi:hypothetical protein